MLWDICLFLFCCPHTDHILLTDCGPAHRRVCLQFKELQMFVSTGLNFRTRWMSLYGKVQHTENIEGNFKVRKLGACYICHFIINSMSRSQWPRGLNRRSAAARLLRLRVRIPPMEWTFVSYERCMLPDRGLCDELITCPEESYWLWSDFVCDLEISRMRRQWPALSRGATGGEVIV